MDRIETYEFVDKVLERVKDDDDLMRKFVFEFLTTLAINGKAEKFLEYAERWKTASNSSEGIKVLKLAQQFIKELGDD